MRRRIVPVLTFVLLLGGAMDSPATRADPAPAAPVASRPYAVTLATGDRVVVAGVPNTANYAVLLTANYRSGNWTGR